MRAYDVAYEFIRRGELLVEPFDCFDKIRVFFLNQRADAHVADDVAPERVALAKNKVELAASDRFHGARRDMNIGVAESSITVTKLGYEVQTARDGAEAIALYEEARSAGKGFDAVLLDLTVSGGMGGLEAAAKLKELDPASKLIVSSGYSNAPVMSDFAKYGFDAVVPKPWTAAEISQVFRTVLVADTGRKTE